MRLPIRVARSLQAKSLRFLSSTTEFSSVTGGGARSPFADPARTRLADLSKPSKTVEIKQEEPLFAAATFETTKSPATDDFQKLKDTLEKLEASSSGGNSAPPPPPEDEEAKHQAEIEKRRRRVEKSTKIGGYVLASAAVIGGVSFCLYYGQAKKDANGHAIPDQYTGQWTAPFSRIYDSVFAWRDFVVEPSREKLLPDPLQYPYIQPKYTIVIEMKNILVNPQWTYKTGYRFLKRPALDYFLDVVGYPNFELVIYTAESVITASPVIDSIDPKHRIMFRLHKDCTKYANGQHLKDLSRLNRDLSKVIYIDYDAKAGSLNPDNMLCIPEWKGNMDDTALVDLAELLKTIHLSDADDVRPMLQYYSQFDDPSKEFRRRAIYLNEQEQKKTVAAEDSSMLRRYTGSLFGRGRHQAA